MDVDILGSNLGSSPTLTVELQCVWLKNLQLHQFEHLHVSHVCTVCTYVLTLVIGIPLELFYSHDANVVSLPMCALLARRTVHVFSM